jgi:hypothetical protein
LWQLLGVFGQIVKRTQRRGKNYACEVKELFGRIATTQPPSRPERIYYKEKTNGFGMNKKGYRNISLALTPDPLLGR